MSARHYLFAVVDGGGNVPVELSAARRLVNRGHAVTVLAEDSVAADVRSTGAALRPWESAPNRPDRKPANDPTRDWECKYPWQLVDRLLETVITGPAGRYADDVGQAIEATSPDLVVCSMFCVGGMVAAERAGVPFDVAFSTIYPLPAPGIPPFGTGLEPARTFIGRWRDRALNVLAERLWNKGVTELNRLRSEYGLTPLVRLLDQLRRARRQLVLTSAAFDFPGTLPANARYVGPVLDDPEWAERVSWTPPPGDDPLVLVAMSSTYQEQLTSLQRVIHALSNVPVRAVVTTGPALDPVALQREANIEVVPSAPHRQVLQQAALVVTHGGHGTVIKALAAGVPMVVLPHGRDQADVAARVRSRGAGLVLKRGARPAVIAGAVTRILRDVGGTPTVGVPPGVRWVINGRSFDPSRVDAKPRLDDIEVWRFVNRGFLGQSMLHPVHTHLAAFQILRRNGGTPLRHEAGWKDTVAIEDGEDVDVIVRWSGHRGRYVLHCHNLEHEDHSMMARVDVG